MKFVYVFNKHEAIIKNQSEELNVNEKITEVNYTEEPRVYTCNICGFITKTKAYLPINIATKHSVQENVIDNKAVVEDNDSDAYLE